MKSIFNCYSCPYTTDDYDDIMTNHFDVGHTVEKVIKNE